MADDYEVGYRKPPQHTRFKKGRSGNPKGRPKGTRNFETDLREELAEPVRLRQDGRVTTVSSQRAALKQLRAQALKGDRHGLDRFIGLAERYGEDEADEHGGVDGEAAIKVEHGLDLGKLTLEQLRQLEALLEAAQPEHGEEGPGGTESE